MSNEKSEQTYYRNCNLCEATCGLEIQVKDNQIVSIRGDQKDPLSQGYLCPKATALEDLQKDPDRLKYPVRRTQQGWEQMEWDEAFEEVSHQLKAIQGKYGRHAVGSYLGNPNVHSLGASLFAPALVQSLKTANHYSASTVDQFPHQFVSYLMFGHQLCIPIPDVERTNFFLMLGANPLASNGSMMTAPNIANRLKALQQRGGKLVVVDPRHTQTADLADQHFYIRPGTDVYLMLALLHTVFDEKLSQLGHLASIVDGVETVQAWVLHFPPEKVEAITGVSAKNIRQLARDFARAASAVCYGRLGVSVQEFGSITQWLITVFNIVTGNLDRPGGALFTKPAIDLLKLTAMIGQQGHYARRYSRVRNLPEFAGEFPVATMAEEILTEGKGQIKALVTIAGNPVLSTPNGRQLEKALASLEFMVAIDFYINETTKHANIILPPTSPLERIHYDIVFHALAVHNTAKYSPAALQAPPNTKHDWEICLELQRRMTTKAPLHQLTKRLSQKTMEHLFPDPVLDLLLRFGPYGDKGNPLSQGINLKKLKKEPHGIDLGPLEPCMPERLFHKNKRIPLVPQVMLQELERAKVRLAQFSTNTENKKEWDLLLIGRRNLRTCNSWMHNSQRLVKGKNRCTALIHPTDAEKRGIHQGDALRVSSRVGFLEIEAEIDQNIMPGVISIPHGWGHDREGIQLRVAQQNAGVSINDITDDAMIDPLCGNAVLNGVPVRVEKNSH
ncbi:molybdopterin oxidoreductase family protein [Deltaproteobacteria bacterium TL4]